MPKPFHVPGPELSPGAEVREHDDASGLTGASLESVPKKKRKRYSASEKLRIVKAANAAVASGKRGALEELMRREGIYSSHLSAWRQQLGARGEAGLAAQKPGRKPKLDEKDRKVLALEKENAKLRRKLQVADAVIGLQKKAHEVLGIALPEYDEESL
ncbi:MAG: transposase [Steroidobacteraceae bacterium]